MLYYFITLAQMGAHSDIEEKRVITNFVLPDDMKLCGYLKRKEGLYIFSAYLIMLVGLAKMAGFYPLTCGIFDKIAGKILMTNFFIWIVSKITTLHICQVYCPF